MDMPAGAVFPEEPFSLQHWLDSLGTVLLLYSAYKGVQSQQVIPRQISSSATQANLLDELANNGVKYNADDVVAISQMKDGRIVWLENGNNRSGLNHILQAHGSEFVNKGISLTELPGYMMDALKTGKIIGYQGRGKGRAIYEFTYQGKIQRVAITVSSNGYIVGANPVSSK